MRCRNSFTQLSQTSNQYCTAPSRVILPPSICIPHRSSNCIRRVRSPQPRAKELRYRQSSSNSKEREGKKVKERRKPSRHARTRRPDKLDLSRSNSAPAFIYRQALPDISTAHISHTNPYPNNKPPKYITSQNTVSEAQTTANPQALASILLFTFQKVIHRSSRPSSHHPFRHSILVSRRIASIASVLSGAPYLQIIIVVIVVTFPSGFKTVTNRLQPPPTSLVSHL